MEGPSVQQTLMHPEQLGPLVSSATFWLAASVLVGSVANHIPPELLSRPAHGHGRPEQPRGQALTSQLRIRVWKRWIPDAGGALPGGVVKASLVRRDRAALERLITETRRAELVHWVLGLAWLLTALWLPVSGVMLNLLFALLFNIPCLLLQRYNRRRLLGCLARMIQPEEGLSAGNEPINPAQAAPRDEDPLPVPDRRHAWPPPGDALPPPA